MQRIFPDCPTTGLRARGSTEGIAPWTNPREPARLFIVGSRGKGVLKLWKTISSAECLWLKKKKLQRIQPNRHISWFPLEIQLTQPSYRAVHPIFTSRTTTSFLPAALCCGCAPCHQGIFPAGWEGALCARRTAEQALTAKEAVVTEESFAPAHPRLRFRTGKCGSSEYPLFPLPHTLTAGSASKSKCKRLNHLVQPGGSCKGRSSGGMLVSPGMPFISAGAVSEASCCLEVVWRVLWGPAYLSSILSIATWIPASALVFCAKAKSRALCTPPRMVRK